MKRLREANVLSYNIAVVSQQINNGNSDERLYIISGTHIHRLWQALKDDNFIVSSIAQNHSFSVTRSDLLSNTAYSKLAEFIVSELDSAARLNAPSKPHR